jgi:transmembrane sensor
LKYVIPQINRYSAKPIVLADGAVGEIEFSGTVFQGQVEDWVRAVASAFPVAISETDHQIFIRARGDAATPTATEAH